jgi:hypothetical protein
MIDQFAAPVRLLHLQKPVTQVQTTPFRIFTDPPLKAGEYMSALLFRRGDVKPSPHTVELLVDSKAIAGHLPLDDFPASSVLQVSLLSTLGVRVPESPDSAPRGSYHVDLSISPDDSQPVVTLVGAGAQTINETASSSKMAEMIERVRQAGILPPENRTDLSKGIYQSDTAQILLDEKAGTIQVTTPMSQGGSLFPGDPGIQLPNLSAKLTGADGAVFAGSLTDKPLGTSPRILLLIVTDALNTGMTFEDATRRTIVNLGGGPALMRVVQADISLRTTAAGKPHLWALAANGERVEEIPTTHTDGVVSARIDTGALSHGPTPYFELVYMAP